ncbi:MAG: hypothetical protein WC310_00870 [Patescibacteria group bacterium]|jgi:hypothetical protein
MNIDKKIIDRLKDPTFLQNVFAFVNKKKSPFSNKNVFNEFSRSLAIQLINDLRDEKKQKTIIAANEVKPKTTNSGKNGIKQATNDFKNNAPSAQGRVNIPPSPSPTMTTINTEPITEKKTTGANSGFSENVGSPAEPESKTATSPINQAEQATEQPQLNTPPTPTEKQPEENEEKQNPKQPTDEPRGEEGEKEGEEGEKEGEEGEKEGEEGEKEGEENQNKRDLKDQKKQDTNSQKKEGDKEDNDKEGMDDEPGKGLAGTQIVTSSLLKSCWLQLIPTIGLSYAYILFHNIAYFFGHSKIFGSPGEIIVPPTMKAKMKKVPKALREKAIGGTINAFAIAEGCGCVVVGILLLLALFGIIIIIAIIASPFDTTWSALKNAIGLSE